MKNNRWLKRCTSVLLLFIVFFAKYPVEATSAEAKIVPENEIYGAYRDFNGYYGFFNYYGSRLKEAKFDLMWQWDDEVIILRRDGKFGAINYKGLPAISFQYEFLDRPSDGTVIYGTDITVEGPTHYGLLDTKGRLIVEAQFVSVEKMPGGGIVTAIDTPKGRQFGVVFKNKVNIRPVYDGVVDYNNQYVIVRNKIDQQWRYGFISANGSRSETIYDKVYLAEDGQLVIAEWTENNQKKVAYFNQYGAQTSKEAFAFVSEKAYVNNYGQAKYFTAVLPYINGKKAKGLDLMNTSGTVHHKALKAINYTPVLKDLYQVTDLNNQIGFVDAYGQEVIQPTFTAIDQTTDQYFVGVNGESRGVFDRGGQAVIPLSTYDEIQISPDNYFVARKGKQFNVFNEQAYLQFQFVGKEVVGIGQGRFITIRQSPYKDADGTPKYYYNLVNEQGRERIKKDQYVYMQVIGENRLAVAKDTDGKATYPSGGIEYLRADFANHYGVYDFDGEEILPVAYKNLSIYKKGLLFAQAIEESQLKAFNMAGKKINPEPIQSFDPFNWGVVTLQPYENVVRSGYLNKEGKFIRLVIKQKVDDTIIDQRLEMDDPFITIVESKTSVYSKEVVRNLINEEIIKGYVVLKKRYGGEIFILKDREWYLDTFPQEEAVNK